MPPTTRTAHAPRTTIRIGAHVSSSGGAEHAADRAHALGCDTLQIFSASPRTWRATPPSPQTCSELRRRRAEFDLHPLVVHANYLINLAGREGELLQRSRQGLRGEIERAVALGAEYLVLHPGSTMGEDRATALERWEEGVRVAFRGLERSELTLLVENTAGGGDRLGGTFVEVAELLDRLKGLPVAACIDTCHCWVAGYDVRSASGFEATMTELDATIGLARVPVLHANDAKAARGSHLDRHEHIGEGQLGRECFRLFLNDPRMAGKAFILETPVDEPGDAERNLKALRGLVTPRPPARRAKRV